MFSNQLKAIISSYYPLTFPITLETKPVQVFMNFLHDPRNAALGDSLVNFIYSVAKSLASANFTGTKVPDYVMVDAYKESLLFTKLKLTGERKKLGNTLESLVLATWVYDLLTLDDLVLRLKEELDPKMFKNITEERRTATKAFIHLYNVCAGLLFSTGTSERILL